MKRTNRMRDPRGFTLIELLVVIIIIGLLAALVGPRFFGKVGTAKLKATKAQIEMFGTALDTFRLDVGRYPTTEEGLKRLNELKGELKVSWDELVVEAVCSRYNLDKAVMALPNTDTPAKEGPAAEQQAPVETAKEAATGKTKRKSTKG